ncbi:MAG: CRISPR-associated endonuclease Cas1 [Planctomycetaceae bacterium]|nr:MAG: CRISPR-associated endonuclease Cas1 [Planctomycetaceae bacterium]
MIQPADDPSDLPSDAVATERTGDGYLPARMINEAVYCPRLFYLMHVEGQFEHNRDTIEGLQVHKRVDQKTDRLKPPPSPPQPSLFELETSPEELPGEAAPNPVKPAVAGDPELRAERSSDDSEKPVHARSVTLASDSLQVVAKLDLVEASGNRATPVDYKKGHPRVGRDGMPSAWDPERVQLCLQALVLRENGFVCDEGILYFNETRQRVRVPIDDDLVRKTIAAVELARGLEDRCSPPPPLVASPKCPRCSLVAICLPDETNRCRAREASGGEGSNVRLPATPRDDLRPLYLNTQGLQVGRKSEVLEVRENGKVIQEVRLREINQVNLFGNIQVTTQALQTLVEMGVPVVMHSQRGYFQGMVHGTSLKNILLRREQFRLADDPIRSLRIAKALIVGKIRNQRVLLMRNHVDPPRSAVSELKRMVSRAEAAKSAESLLGIEGTAARIYFQHFAGMLKPGDEPLDPLNSLGEPPRFRFDFRGRNRRPPRDPVNALLSFTYALLAKDLTIVATAVGFDPYLGFFHLPRPGRPALSLDLMEPFRPLIADSVVLLAINNRMVYPEHFIEAGQGVTMTSSGRKGLIRAYEQRMDQLVTHPLFDYRVSYRRLLEIQTRLMARVVSGELRDYPTFVTR